MIGVHLRPGMGNIQCGEVALDIAQWKAAVEYSVWTRREWKNLFNCFLLVFLASLCVLFPEQDRALS